MPKSPLIIKSVKLENFRCHARKNQNFTETTTKILGPNGCGKTSILEAIYLAMRGKSFRAVDREIVKRDQDFYRVELDYYNNRKVVVFHQNEKKTFLIDDKKTARLPKDYRYPVVLFEPKDLHIIDASPSRRRTFFDRVFSQLAPEYSIYLSRYNKALQQRNKAFKDEFITSDMVFPWNLLLAEYGSKIQQLRDDLIVEINQQITPVYQQITGHEDKIYISYKNEKIQNVFIQKDKQSKNESPENNKKSKQAILKTDSPSREIDENLRQNISESQYLKILERNFERDKVLGCTGFGIHQDQYQILFNHQPADGSASRGEGRSVMIALKFIEADLIFQRYNQRPLILLDDVFSELDQKHQNSLTKNFKNHQVILTSVE